MSLWPGCGQQGRHQVFAEQGQQKAPRHIQSWEPGESNFHDYLSHLFLSRIMTRLHHLCLQLQAPARVPGPWCLFPQEEKLQTPPGSTYLARNYFNLHLLGADCGSSFQPQPVTTHPILPWPSLSTIIFLNQAFPLQGVLTCTCATPVTRTSTVCRTWSLTRKTAGRRRCCHHPICLAHIQF